MTPAPEARSPPWRHGREGSRLRQTSGVCGPLSWMASFEAMTEFMK